MSADTVLRNAVLVAAQTLPVVGDPNSNDLLLLAHYSENPLIGSFKATDLFSWITHTPADPQQIYTFTGKLSLKFQAIYLVSVGISPIYKTRVHDGGLGRIEHAIDLALPPGDFKMLPITYDPAIQRYVP